MRRIGASLLWLAVLAPAAGAQQAWDTVQVRTTPVAGGVYMLAARGGNIGVSIGADGVFLVDDQYAPLTEKIRTAVAALSSGPIRFVLNTHWHGDHTGGNENMGKAGVLIVAHDNVRRRMTLEQFDSLFRRTTAPAPAGALPVVTFTDAVTFYLNGDSIHVFHVPPAHTDGDAIVHFRRANVIHMGDVFFNGTYPFVDRSSGGSVDGVIGAVERVITLANPETKIIPGHGALATRTDLQRYRDMLVGAREAVRRAMAGGRSLEQVIAAKPTAAYDATWGGGFITPDRFVEIVYRDLSRR